LHPLVELLLRDGPGHGVAGIANQPELNAAGCGIGQHFGMMWADGLVFHTLDEQYRKPGPLDASERTGLEKIEAVAQSGVDEG
jgi:hypothetical protein